MKNIILLTIVFTSVLALMSCKSDDSVNTGNLNLPIDSSDFRYPVTIGNSWNYQTSLTITDIRPDSIRHHFPTGPVSGIGTIRSEKDTLINGVSTRLFRDRYTQDSNSFESRVFYVHEDSALKIYAYSLSNSSYIFPRGNGNNIYFIFNKRSYRSLYELFICLKNNLAAPDGNDTIIAENPPVTALMYPIVSNKEWVYRQFSIDSLMKRYLNFENINVGSKTISCMKTQMDWIHWDNEYMYYYYSKFGLLKSDIFVDNIEVTNEFGVTIGFVDSRELALVNSYVVAE